MSNIRHIVRFVCVIALCLAWPWVVILCNKAIVITNSFCKKWASLYGDTWPSIMLIVLWLGIALLGVVTTFGLFLRYCRIIKSSRLICDEAINGAGDDYLQRDAFVKALLSSFRGASVYSSGAKYVALYAPWGDGKTSVINLLKEAKKDCIWGELNVWPDESHAHPACKLYCSLAKALFRNFHWILSWRFLVMAVRLSAKDVVSEFGFTLSIPLGLISAIFTIFGTVEGMRKQNGERLRRYLGKEIVIVVDDLDRLPPNETMRILMMLRSFGDLPNVTYIIAAEQKHLLASVADELPDGHNDIEAARHFLEKFMTHDYRLPVINSDVLSNMLRKQLKYFCSGHEVFGTRIDSMLLEMVLPYITNIRSLKRYMAALEFEWKMQCSKNEYGTSLPSVNLFDVASLIAIRVFEPLFYDKLWPSCYHVILKNSEKLPMTDPKCVSEKWLEENLYSYASNKDSAKRFMEYCLGLQRKYDVKAENQRDKTIGYYFSGLDDPERCANYSLASSVTAANYFSSHVSTELIPMDLFNKFFILVSKECDFDLSAIESFLRTLDERKRIPSLLNALKGIRLSAMGRLDLRNIIRAIVMLGSKDLENASQYYRSKMKSEWLIRDSLAKTALNVIRPVIAEDKKKDNALSDYLAECLCEVTGTPAMLVVAIDCDLFRHANKDFTKAEFSKEVFEKMINRFISLSEEWKGVDIKALDEYDFEKVWMDIVAYYDLSYGSAYKKAHAKELNDLEWVTERMNKFRYELQGLHKTYVGLDAIDACMGAEHVRDMLERNIDKLSLDNKEFLNELKFVMKRKEQGEPYNWLAMQTYFMNKR